MRYIGKLRDFAVVATALLTLGAPAAKAQTEEVILNHLTAPAGIGEYEWSLSFDRLLAQNSSWLEQRSQPTQGYIYNLRVAIESEDKWDTLVFNIDPISIWLADQKKQPFTEGIGNLEVAGLMNATWPIWMLVTADPDVKDLSDLAGRRVALGAKAGTAALMMEETLKAAGIFDQIEVQYLSFADITTGLLDDTIEVGLANLWYNAAANKVGPTQGILNLQASGREFHYVTIDKAVMEKTKNERGVPYMILTVPDGSMPLQTGEMAVFANPTYVGVSKDFPENTAYEYVRIMVAQLDAINRTGGIASIFTPDFLPFGIENLHPGAARAYREAGLMK